MTLIQVVPGLPPRVDGIGDYALQLARQLRERHNITSSFIVCDPSWSGGEIEGFYATKVARRTPEAFLDAAANSEQALEFEPCQLLVQFSPYGYEKRGCPFWLAEALEKWERSRSGALNVVFHELEVHGLRPWSSTFWVPPIQRALIRRVARLGKFQYTNTELYRRKLEDWGAGRMTLIPNFSTIGEPHTNPPFWKRRKDVIVFGRGAQRQWTYERGSEALHALCKRIGAERIIDIGAPIPGDAKPEIRGIPVVRCGRLEAGQVNQWMATSVASFMYYPVPLLTKSSVHAVSCAHGTIPFVLDDQARDKSCPGLVTGEDFVPVARDTLKLTLPSLEDLSSTVFNNYQARASWAAADKVARYIFGQPQS